MSQNPIDLIVSWCACVFLALGVFVALLLAPFVFVMGETIIWLVDLAQGHDEDGPWSS